MTEHLWQNRVVLKVIMQWIISSCILLLSVGVYAETALRSAEDAFLFSVDSIDDQYAQLKWKIPQGYYLYQHKFAVQQDSQSIPLDLSKAHDLFDENYGHTQVYYQQVKIKLLVQPSKKYQVEWQGCAKDRICYPPQKIEFETDYDGLVALSNIAPSSPKFLDLAKEPINTQSNVFVQDTPTETNSNSLPIIASDQMWLEKLAHHSFVYGLILFLGLGILLAFTPCSLPMIPILSSLIVRNHKGLKAWVTALTFVLSMAMVYAVLGLIASSAGLNFQRWLQQPITLIAFSILFIIFALNLFGIFELKLPQSWVNKLDHAQAMQKSGGLVSTIVMGMISALLVGPCMTAPLAGALLFISQTQSQWHGAILLFTLGFGMGLPLLIASILGAHFLPKVGNWMHQIKVIFAFLMLGLALYFIRPLISEIWMQGLSLLLSLGFIAYILYKLMWNKTVWKWGYIALLFVAVPYIVYTQYQQSQKSGLHSEDVKGLSWHVAKSATQFKSILASAPQNQNIIIDVYADWCVACQPIEHRILRSAKVQMALKDYFLIKLDLSHYDEGHQALLNELDILGPPTYLFFNKQKKEIRGLRMTGAFSEQELIEQLQKFKKDNS